MSSRRMPPSARGLVMVLSLAVVAGLAVLGVSGIEKARGGTGSGAPSAGVSATAPTTGTRTSAGGHWITVGDAPTTGAGGATSSSAGAAPPAPSQLGAVVEIRHGDSNFRMTVGAAGWQPGASWDSPHRASNGGFLVVPVTVTRLSGGRGEDAFNYSDFELGGQGAPVEPELIGGGYVGEFSSIDPGPGKKVSGNVVFDVPYRGGLLRLTDSDTVLAQWDLGTPGRATAPKTAAMGQRIASPVGQPPFRAAVTATTWYPTSDPSVGEKLDNGFLLVVTVEAIPDPKALQDDTYLAADQWSFVAKGSPPSTGNGGTIGSERVGPLSLSAGGGTASTRVMFDAVGKGGIVRLTGRDGTPLMSWNVPGP